MRSRWNITAPLFLIALSTLLAGCGVGTSVVPTVTPSAGVALTGRVHGGQQPVSGATIQLYEANVTGANLASKPLISSAVVTNAQGYFTITGTYTCTSATTLVYIAATGGNPGLAAGSNNRGIAMMTVLGTCGSLTATTFIQINELTTVVAVECLAPFMLDITHVSVDPVNIAGLTAAFTSATTYINFSTGVLNVVTGGPVIPVTLFNTLANILAACVNTAGGAANDGTICGKLYSYSLNGTVYSTDTILAILYIVRFPSQNVALLYSLIVTAPPFLPELTVVPTDFTVGIVFVINSNIAYGDTKVVVDKNQHVWVMEPTIYGTLTVFDNNLNLIKTISLSTLDPTGSFTALDLAADPFGYVWTIATTSTGQALFKFADDGSVASPTGGYPLPETPTNYIISTLQTLTIDSSGNIWTNSYDVNGDYCFAEFSNSGKAISPSPGFCGNEAKTIAPSIFAALDGTIWNANILPLSITGVDSNGVSLTPVGGNLVATGTQTLPMAFDAKLKHFWLNDSNNSVVRNVNVDGTQNFTNGIIPVAATGYYSAAVDDNGTLWTCGVTGIGAMSATGTLLSPYILQGLNAHIGYHPAGLSTGYGLAIDAAGNVFTVDSPTNRLIKASGLAGPKTHI
jgi:hypothetical protein